MDHPENSGWPPPLTVTLFVSGHRAKLRLKKKKGTRESFIWKYPQVGCADPNSPKIRISLTTWLHALLLTEWLYRANNWLEIRISAPLTWFHEVLLIKRFFRANNCLKIRISEATRFYAVLLTKRPHRTNNWPPIVHRTGQRTRQCIPTHAPTHTDWRRVRKEWNFYDANFTWP